MYLAIWYHSRVKSPWYQIARCTENPGTQALSITRNGVPDSEISKATSEPVPSENGTLGPHGRIETVGAPQPDPELSGALGGIAA